MLKKLVLVKYDNVLRGVPMTGYVKRTRNVQFSNSKLL